MRKLEPGMMVTQNVRLVELVGEGAMGCVWAAQHLGLHTRVAVKFIAEELSRDHPDVLMRFRTEAAASAQIKSPYVVQTYDHGVTEDGTPYIVMEYLEGEGLGERLERANKLSLKQTAQVLVQVGKALDRAHQLGIVHRDIKPDNIFLSTAEDGLICKVLDFGIAKHTKLADQKGVTLPGTTVGTPEYMSREQVMTAREVDASADLWALAVVAYQCLTGELPFVGETLGMVCVAICRGDFPLPSELRHDLPKGIDDWFTKALHRDPAERFRSGKEMALQFLRLVPREEDPELDAMVSTGQFSLPPPAADSKRMAVDMPRSGAVSLFDELEDSLELSRPGLPPPPSGRGAGGGRRDGTPTFSGSSSELSSAELMRMGGGRSRRAVLGVVTAVLLVGGVVGLVAIMHGKPTPAADGSPTATPTAGTSPANGAGSAQPAGVASGTGANPGTDAGSEDRTTDTSAGTASSGRVHYPGPKGTKGKKQPKDLGF